MAPVTEIKSPVKSVPVDGINQTKTLEIQVVLPMPTPVEWYMSPPIVVSGLTLVGVIITLVIAWIRMNKELSAAATQSHNALEAAALQATLERDHSRDEARRNREHAAQEAHQERITTARREVYLQLIGEMTKASIALTGLPSQKGEDLDVESGFGGLLSCAAKVGILGQMDTVVKSRELTIEIQDVLFAVMPEIAKMKVMKLQEAEYREKSEGMMEKAKRFQVELAEAIQRGDPQPTLDTKYKAIANIYADAEKYLSAAHNEAQNHFLQLQGYQQKVLSETGRIAMKVNELIVCIRNELKLETDADVLVQMTEKMHERSMASVRSLQDTINSM